MILLGYIPQNTVVKGGGQNLEQQNRTTGILKFRKCEY